MTSIRGLALKLRVLYRAWRLRVRADPVKIRCILRHLREGDVAVDVGSHKGGFTYWMRRAVGSSGMVYSFEPQPESASYQREIVRVLELENVVVEALALSSSRRQATFSARPGGFHPGGRLGPAEPAPGEISFRVETETLDHYFAAARRPVSLIKVDAEGHEHEILRGARRILSEDRPLLLLECERHRHPRRSIRPIFDSLLALGYAGHFIHRSKLVDLGDFDEEKHQVGDRPEVNDFVFFPPPPKPRIFVSYARSDGGEVARRLRDRLTGEHGFALWQDLKDLEGGRSWWEQIVEAIRNVEYLVLVMTHGALRSDVVRKEWRLARQEGVCVLPVIGAEDLDFSTLPSWMREVHFVDPGDSDQWRRFIRTLEGPCRVPRVPFMAEDLPDDFVPRQEELGSLIGCLLDEEREEPVAITAALRGAGGFGKTTLARAVCHDQRILEAFHDGIVWVTLGQDPGDLTRRVEDLIVTISGERTSFASVEAAAAHLSTLLADMTALLVIDDVWNRAHVTPFLQGGPRCARLITTRDSSTLPAAARRITVDAMQETEAVELLGSELEEEATEALQEKATEALKELASRLGEWPLLLKLVNRFLRNRVKEMEQELPDAVAHAHERLHELGLTGFDARNPLDRNRAVSKTLSLSLEGLSPGERQRLTELAIFPQDRNIPLPAVQRLWDSTAELRKGECLRLCENLFHLSLIQRFDPTTREIVLHEVICTYLRELAADSLPQIHSLFLATYSLNRWADLPAEEDYVWRHLAYHLVAADRSSELQALLQDFDWLEAKLQCTDIGALISDFDLLPESRALPLIHGALRLSAHHLARDKSQLASQLTGRLLTFDDSEVRSFVQQTRDRASPPWLRPYSRSLDPAGGALVATLVGHREPIRAIAFLPGSDSLVSASFDRSMKRWDLQTGAETKSLAGAAGDILAVAVTPDRRRVVSASDDCKIRIWDLQSGQVVQTLLGHEAPVLGVALAPRANCVVSASADRTLKVWDLATGNELRTLRGHDAEVLAVAVTDDERFVVSGSDDCSLRIWSLESAEELLRFEGHEQRVGAVDVTPDGSRVVSASDDGLVKVWDVESGSELLSLSGHEDRVLSIALSPEGGKVVTASRDHTVRVWEVDSGLEKQTLRGHEGPVLCVAVAQDGRRLVSGSSDHTLKIWSLEAAHETPPDKCHEQQVSGVAVSPDGETALTASYDGTLKLWNLRSCGEDATLVGHRDAVHAVAIAPDGRRAVSASDDGSVGIWDLARRRMSGALRGHRDGVRAIAVTPDGKTVISGSDDWTIRLWGLDDGRELASLEGHQGWILSLAVAPDGVHLISASDDRTLKVWNLESRSLERTLEGHEDWVLGVAIAPDGRRAVSASNDPGLKVWNLTTSEEELTLKGHERSVVGVAHLPDSELAVSASFDRTLKVWDLANGDVLAEFSGDAALTCCGVSPDGRTLLAGDASGRLHFLHFERDG